MGLNDVLNDRDKTHGDFRKTFELACRLVDATKPTGGVPESAVQRHAREMICAKLARIACGDPTFVDHWQDIAGYASLVVKDEHLGTGLSHGLKPNLVDPPRPFPPRPYAAPSPEFKHRPQTDLNP